MTDAVVEQSEQAQAAPAEQQVEQDEQATSQQSLEQSLEQTSLEELAIVVLAKGLNPASFTPDFLVHSGIIPADWALVRKPTISPQLSQVVFQNGISLTAEPNKVTFSESVMAKADEELTIAKLAAQYVETLPNAAYLAVGINPQKVVPFSDRPKDVHTFVTQTLLQPGPWQELGNAPMQASLNLAYQLEDWRLQLSLNPTELRLPGDALMPSLLFAGNFHYELKADGAEARKTELLEAIASWSEQLDCYRSLIEKQFLGMLS